MRKLVSQRFQLEDEIIPLLVVSVDNASRKSRQDWNLAAGYLSQEGLPAGLFVFHDQTGAFRLSLVCAEYRGRRKPEFSDYRRYSFVVQPGLPNKTFVQQMFRAESDPPQDLESLKELFSVEAVTDEFYQEFKPHYERLAEAVKGEAQRDLKEDFALLFVIRTIFIGFVQKKGWLGGNPRFLQDFWEEYKSKKARGETEADTFYSRWLEPLFFEALSSPPGRKVAYRQNDFSQETERILQMAPYLNGELFKRKRGVDDQGLSIPDEPIEEFFNFLFQYNFTVEENTFYDKELELNPEFLGIIFERLVNKDLGAVYTPRTEVDLMCRMSLLYWLLRNTEIKKEILYRLFFPSESDLGPEELSPDDVRELIQKLEKVTVCDPAAGSGAFMVGMLQVLDDLLRKFYTHPHTPQDLQEKAPGDCERKRAIIARSLYGVEVKRWAVWISQLRLWLALFVDMPDELLLSLDPLLPNLEFKVRRGDALIQRVGSRLFPVHGHADLPKPLKRKITELRKLKNDFFYNRNVSPQDIVHKEFSVFREILEHEIAKKENRIKKLKAYQPSKQKDLYVREPREASLIQKEIEKLEREIEEIKSEIAGLAEERPFIWSLEFAEIFFERKGFDIVIGNPPYVRQEDIRDPEGKLSPREYKTLLVKMLQHDFPDHFGRPDHQPKRRPDGRSDLYTYFYVRSLRLLNPQGIHVFICSNSWLDVGYGAWLQEFLLRKVPMLFILDNHARRSFASSDINTVITVFQAPLTRGEVPRNHKVKFVAFKKPFEEVVSAENLLEIEAAESILKNERFRVFPITVEELLREGSEFEDEAQRRLGAGQYMGDKWGGKYLRAPDIFFTILEKARRLFVLNYGGEDILVEDITDSLEE